MELESRKQGGRKSHPRECYRTGYYYEYLGLNPAGDPMNIHREWDTVLRSRQEDRSTYALDPNSCWSNWPRGSWYLCVSRFVFPPGWLRSLSRATHLGRNHPSTGSGRFTVQQRQGEARSPLRTASCWETWARRTWGGTSSTQRPTKHRDFPISSLVCAYSWTYFKY